MMSLTKNPNYRPDIDGLRAVAVLLVVLFHAGLGFPGGYVGVDVFFVISGYLITGIIVREVESERGFSLARFWQRRIHRLLPAASAMAISAALVAPLILTPVDLLSFSKSLLAQSVFASNFYFAKTASYFASTSELWPLLHTWSLAVEEQFYLVFPIFVLALWRIGKSTSTAKVGLLCILAASLLLSIILTGPKPGFSFYLLPTRAWELALGAWLAVTRIRSSDYLATLGLALIVGSAIWFDRSTPFPGGLAIVPCIGASFVVARGGQGSGILSRILGGNCLVAIGLASYSIYLWHWPVLAYFRYVRGVELSFASSLAAVALTAVLSVVSYRFIETPLRGLSGRWSVARSFALGTCLLAVLAGFGAIGIYTDGGKSRLATREGEPDWESWFPEFDPQFAPRTISLGCARDRVDFILWGDSHAVHLAPTVDRLARQLDLSGVLLGGGGHLPVPGFGGECDDGVVLACRQDRVMDAIESLGPKMVIIAARWDAYLRPSPARLVGRRCLYGSTQMATASLVDGLLHLDESLARSGIELFAVGQVASLEERWHRNVFLEELWGIEAQVGACKTPGYAEAFRSGREALQLGLGASHVILPNPAVDPVVNWRGNGALLYTDYNHLSRHGADILYADAVLAVLEELRSEKDQASFSVP